MATAPVFASTPRSAQVSIATANANRDGTGTVGTLFTAGASGSKVEEVRITPRVTTTAGMVRLYVHTGAAYFLYGEYAIAALTLSATVPAVTTTITYDNLVLPTGYSLRCSTEKAEAIDVHAFGGDF